MSKQELFGTNKSNYEFSRLKVRRKWRQAWRNGLLATLIAGAPLFMLPFSTVQASGEQIVLGMPFTGHWAYNVPTFAACGTDASQTAHPSCHGTNGTDLLGYHWAIDYYAADGTSVKMNASSPQGVVTFASSLISGETCGQGLNIIAKVNGTEVGRAYVTHLDNAVASSNIANGNSIGTVHNECFGVDHVHFSYKNSGSNYSCYINYSDASANAGMQLSYGSPVGVLGSANTGARQTCSSLPSSPPAVPAYQDGTSASGDFNGDGYADMALFHKRTDGGADVKIAYGASGSSALTTVEHRISLPGPGWRWDDMKIVAGKFNGDNYTDIAIVHKRLDAGADIKLLYGNALPYTFTSVVHLKELPGSDGWRLDDMKIVAGNFNGDAWDDIAIVHKRYDGGAAIKIVYGNVDGYTFSTVSHTLDMPYVDGWDWSKMLVTAGRYNNDTYSDIGILHRRSDGGADIKIVYGDATPYTLTNAAHLSSLPAASGWSYDNMKVVSGHFNNDPWDDISIIHKHSYDDGADVKIVFGNINGYTLTSNAHRSVLPAANGWNWNNMKLASGDYDSDAYDDIGILHKHSYDAGADIKITHGGVDPSGLTATTHVTILPAANGWDWSKMKIY